MTTRLIEQAGFKLTPRARAALDEARGWKPQWTTTPGLPWRLVDKDGNWFRERRKDGMWMERMFKSAEEATAFVKSSEGRKAIAAFRRMRRRDMNEAMLAKKTKEEVNYRKARAEDLKEDKRCGTCTFVKLPDACAKVSGTISQDDICDLWKRGIADSLDEAKKTRLDWRPYPLSGGAKSTTWKEVFTPEGKKLGHVVPYKYGRGWNAYAVDGRKAKVLKDKAAVEAFFLKESLDEAKIRHPLRTPDKYTGPKYKIGDTVQIVRRYGFTRGKGKKPSPVDPPVKGKVKMVETGALYPKGPPDLTLEINPDDYERAAPGVVKTKYHRIRVSADEVMPLKGKMESLDEAAITLRPGSPDEITLEIKGGEVTQLTRGGKTKKPTADDLHRVRGITVGPARALKGADLKAWKSIKWPTQFRDLRVGQPFEWHGQQWIKVNPGRSSDIVSVKTGELRNAGITPYEAVKPLRRVTIGEEWLEEAKATGKAQLMLLAWLQKHAGKHELSDITRDRSFHGIHFRQVMTAAKALGKKGLVDYDDLSRVSLKEAIDEAKVRVITSTSGSALMFMPVALTPYWWTGSEWSDKKGEARYYDKAGAKAELGNARAAAQKLVKGLKEFLNEAKFTVEDKVKLQGGAKDAALLNRQGLRFWRYYDSQKGEQTTRVRKQAVIKTARGRTYTVNTSDLVLAESVDEVEPSESVAVLSQKAREKGMAWNEQTTRFELKSGDYTVCFFTDKTIAAAYVYPPVKMYKRWKITIRTNAEKLWNKRIRAYIDSLIIAARRGDVTA